MFVDPEMAKVKKHLEFIRGSETDDFAEYQTKIDSNY
jgi:hypothetical protein